MRVGRYRQFAVKDTISRLRRAQTQGEFSNAAKELPLLGAIPSEDTLKLLQTFASCYENSGFEDFSAMKMLTNSFPQLSLHHQVLALLSLSKISPKTRSKELFSLLNCTLSALSQSKLDEIRVESVGLLLDLASEMRLGSAELWQYCVERVLKSSFPLGVLEGALLLQVLRAASELRYDINPLKDLLIPSIQLKSAWLSPLSRAYLALYLAKLQLFESFSVILPEIVTKPVAFSHKSTNLLHLALLGFDLLAPSDLISAANQQIKGLPAYRADLQAYTALHSQRHTANSLSPLHQDVLRALDQLGVAYKSEIQLPAPSFLPIDISMLEDLTLVEVQGPTHYLYSSELPTGATLYKAVLLQKLGFRLVEIPYFQWNRISESCKSAYIRDKLDA